MSTVEVISSVKITNFLIGTLVFFLITLMVSILMPIYVHYNTEDKEQIPTNRR